MPTSYTSLLGLALPVTGELSGTWGDTVNDYITQYLDSAVEGTQTISGSQTSVTLSVTNGTSLSQVGSGSTGSAQYAIINCTGNPASTLTITAPASSRQYLVLNSTSTSQSVIFRGAGPTTGVTLVSGERCIVAWNGSDFVKIATSTADGVTTFSAGTTGFTPSSATSGAVTLAGTLATTNGGTGLTSFTANGVVYASSTSALTTGSALSFDGTVFSVNGGANGSRFAVKGTGAFGGFDTGAATDGRIEYAYNGTNIFYTGIDSASLMTLMARSGVSLAFGANGSEQMRLTSTGLGIGTSSPGARLDVRGNATFTGNATARQTADFTNTGGQLYVGAESSAGGAVFTGSSAYAGIVGTNNNTVLQFATNGTVRSTLDSSGNLGIGTSSPLQKLHVVAAGGYNATFSENSANNVRLQFYIDANETALVSGYNTTAKPMTFYTGGSLRATLDSSGNLGLGVTPSAWGSGFSAFQFSADAALWATKTGSDLILSSNERHTGASPVYIRTGVAATDYYQSAGTHVWRTAPSGTAGNAITFTQRLQITAAGFTQPTAYADTVSALGNTGTAATINLQNANVFTATLTGNCTFTLSNAIATGSSSFTLILTNDGTAGRTVAWAGGSFVFPGGAASLSRTTTANAVDVWVFFTPNGGTTWYGNIAMKDMKA